MKGPQVLQCAIIVNTLWYLLKQFLFMLWQMMKGYFNDPEGTAEIIDKEGWLHTDDIGHYDDKGILYISNRRNELIEYQGNLVK